MQFKTTSSITFQLKNMVEKNKCSCKIFFAIGKCFFQIQTKKVDKYNLKMTF